MGLLPNGYMMAATQKADASTGPIVATATLNCDGAALGTFARMQAFLFSLSLSLELDWLNRFVEMANPLMGPAFAVWTKYTGRKE